MIRTDQTGAVRDALRRHWGFESFRPLQAEAVGADLEGRDSVVVIPTGGGKSLCYQAPAAVREEGLTLVVSPLIALMKDQVDGLSKREIPCALFNSSLSAGAKRDVIDRIRNRDCRLLYVAPERLPDEHFIGILREAKVSSVAIDEAHCISHWGHDFRPDYRRLSRIKDWFPGASLHAFTATATPRVREDIAEQLNLENPVVLVGDFDRPNLTYRAKWRSGLIEQVCEIINANIAGAGIIYCIRRRDVDEMCAALQGKGFRALPYHAGLTAEEREDHQNAFGRNACDIIVATVAFGMGIDRADIRYVIHTGMPKSVEAYQQETGRAGRDGIPAECTLFYTTADYMTWKSIVEMNETEHLDAHLAQLGEMLEFCQSPGCRHRLLVEHFGQEYLSPSCDACDTCLGEREIVPDGTTIARKILSAIVRTGERFGAKYVADVLVGAKTETIHQRGHKELSVFGLMAENHPREICAWIEQLSAAGYLNVGTEYRTFSLTPDGWRLVKGDGEVTLVARPELTRQRRRKSAQPPSSREFSAAPESDAPDDDPADAALYESLRQLRKNLADEKQLPAYCVVSNKTLAHMAAVKPTTEEAMLDIHGMGPTKMRQYGEALLQCVRHHCA